MVANSIAPQTFGIALTTIYDGSFIDAYYDHFVGLGVLDQVRFYVVGDIATPDVCRERIEKYRSQGLPWFYLGVPEQEDFLRPITEMASEIPWKSDNRRNVGFLMAYRDRCDIIVAIDDDNYPKSNWPFLDGHASAGKTLSLPTAVGHEGWFNLCSLMEIDCPSLGGGQTVYARGFPYKRRHVACSSVSEVESKGRVAVNVGLWSGDPDVDAATRLVTCCEARERLTQSFLLAPGTFMPINTQNTAIIREALPAYYYVKMGHQVGGMKLDRFGDIFSGFFLQKAVEAVGDRIRLGSPVVEHVRSPHNLYKDLWHELAGMVVIDDMLPLLESRLSGASNYSDAALELADCVENWAGNQNGFLWDDALKSYFKNVANNMQLWVKTLAEF